MIVSSWSTSLATDWTYSARSCTSGAPNRSATGWMAASPSAVPTPSARAVSSAASPGCAAQREPVVLGVLVVERHLSVAQLDERTLRHLEVEQPVERLRLDHRRHVVLAVDDHRRVAEPGGHVDLGQIGDRRSQLGAEPGAAEVA